MDVQFATHLRAVALAHAMQTATPGEPLQDILTRAFSYAHFLEEPQRVAAKSQAIGEPDTKRLQ